MLAHTDKLASIGLLSAGVAHELNNPLAYVPNNLVVLQREATGLLELVRLYETSRASSTGRPRLLGRSRTSQGSSTGPISRASRPDDRPTRTG